MEPGLPNARYPHLRVVMRTDDDRDAEPAEEKVTLVSAYAAKDDADAEAARLGRENAGKDVCYTVTMTRLKGAPPR